MTKHRLEIKTKVTENLGEVVGTRASYTGSWTSNIDMETKSTWFSSVAPEIALTKDLIYYYYYYYYYFFLLQLGFHPVAAALHQYRHHNTITHT
jgi:hypothetical protein